MGSDSEDMITTVVVLILLVCTAQAQNNPGDECSNQCEEGNPYHWCGKMRQDSSGRVLRCAEGTKIGQACIDSCSSKDESYFWCWTNNHEVGTGSDWWNYCGVEGHTKKGVPCVGVCARQGENYWWCRTDKVDSGAWDYCSPPGQVTLVQYTRYGHSCLGGVGNGICGRHGTDYFWCAKSLRWVEDENNDYSSDDDWWEYCSPDNLHTRYGETCRDECASRGYGYFWCYTGQSGSSWDYCSPQPYSAQEVITKGGSKCAGICDRMSSGYGFCEIKETRRNLIMTMVSWWDYCTSPYMPASGVGLRASLWTLVWTLVVLLVRRNL